jgi:hypothetical protein
MRATNVNWKAYANTSFILTNFPRRYPWEFMACFLPLGVTRITIRISKDRVRLRDREEINAFYLPLLGPAME